MKIFHLFLDKIKSAFTVRYKLPKEETEEDIIKRKKQIAGLVATGNISLQDSKYTTEKEAQEKKERVLSYEL